MQLYKDRDDVAALSFDYMQNLPIPKLPVQEMINLRKMWLYAFSIHNMGSNTATFLPIMKG